MLSLTKSTWIMILQNDETEDYIQIPANAERVCVCEREREKDRDREWDGGRESSLWGKRLIIKE